MHPYYKDLSQEYLVLFSLGRPFAVSAQFRWTWERRATTDLHNSLVLAVFFLDNACVRNTLSSPCTDDEAYVSIDANKKTWLQLRSAVSYVF